MKDLPFFAEARLLVRVLPLVAEEKTLALKGGTAINLFLRNMPRLSVDIDLTYLPIQPRDESLKQIAESLNRLARRIKAVIPGVAITKVVPKGVGSASGLVLITNEAQVKIEVNIVIRGSVFPSREWDLCQRASEEFGTYVRTQILSKADLFGGKLCAALDRQHPRDLFDMKLLLDENGLNNDVRKAFVVYLASHDRPINELLNPTWKNIEETFRDDFQGMTLEEVSLSELLSVREKMLQSLKSALSGNEREFLLSLKRGEPKWELLEITGIEKLPAIQWKLINIRKMAQDKHRMEFRKLEKILSDLP